MLDANLNRILMGSKIVKKSQNSKKKIHIGIQYPGQIAQEERMYIILSKKI